MYVHCLEQPRHKMSDYKLTNKKTTLEEWERD